MIPSILSSSMSAVYEPRRAAIYVSADLDDVSTLHGDTAIVVLGGVQHLIIGGTPPTPIQQIITLPPQGIMIIITADDLTILPIL